MASTLPPRRLPTVYTIDEVIEGIESIIEWSIETASPVGYFAALHKRTTLAIRDASGQGCLTTERGWHASM